MPISFQSVNSSERPGQAADVEIPESATAVPHSDTSAETPETKTQTAFNVPEVVIANKNVHMLNISSPVPKAQLTVDAQSPENNALKEQPKDLEAGRNVSKLNKQRRKKAMRASNSTACQRACMTRNQNESIKSASRSESRNKKLQAMRTKYTQDNHYRKQKLLSSEQHYVDPRVKCKKISYIVKRYKTNPDVQCRWKKYMTRRYNTDSDVRETKKMYTTSRYACDQEYRKKQKAYIKSRYAHDEDYRKKQKQHIHTRYHKDPQFRLLHVLRCTWQKRQKLVTNAAIHIHHKLQCALRIRRKYRRIVIHQTPQPKVKPQPEINPVLQAAMTSFCEKIKDGPTYICTVCHRALFSNQVVHCNRSKLVKKPHVVAACLTGKYVHVCDSECLPTCTVPKERQQGWFATCATAT